MFLRLCDMELNDSFDRRPAMAFSPISMSNWEWDFPPIFQKVLCLYCKAVNY